MQPLRRTVCECKLDDGSIVQYDAASKSKDYYDPEKFKCIGQGRIHSANGVLQPGLGYPMYFFVRKHP
jgi:hypothetical protein